MGKIKLPAKKVEAYVFYFYIFHFSKIVNSLLFITKALFQNMRLSEMRPGKKVTIKSFENPEIELKLMEMGCLPGEEITVEQIAPLGDPIAIRVAGYFLSLRKDEADQIVLEDN